MLVTFNDLSLFDGWDRFPKFIEGIIRSQRATHVCEVGAGANPALSEKFVGAQGLDYTLLDSDAGEIRKTALRAKKIIKDICRPTAVPREAFDIVFSRMMFEHCRDSAMAHATIWRMLRPGGLAVHCFATLYSLPMLVNRFCPGRLTDFLLDHLHPRDRHRHEKFSAWYDMCRGPIRSQIAALEKLGYEICEYHGYFGHYYYRDKLKLLDIMNVLATRCLVRFPVAHLTTYATVILRRRPERDVGEALELTGRLGALETASSTGVPALQSTLRNAR